MIINAIRNKLRIKISLIIIFFIGLGFRFFYFPHELPLIIDGIDNFTYATAINYYGHLPIEWTAINNGWPIFVSFWFSIINLENSFQYMQLQRILSIILSSLVTIPVYFLCRKFFDEKIAIFGAALFSFDPRIVENSLLGIAEPLFILLGLSSLVIFLRYSRKQTFVAFTLVSLCTIVRAEGLFLFFTLTILFFIRYRFSKEILRTYVPCVVIFILILIPIMNYRIEVAGYDGIFQRAALGTNQVITIVDQGKINEIFRGVELFVKYTGWVMIPNFLIFVPFGFIQFLRKRTKETNFIIVFLIVSSLPIFYAYVNQAEDPRYLYFLFPIFCLVSLFAVQSYITKFPRKNIVILLLIVGILISSISFFEYKKIDYEREKELYEITKIVAEKTSGVNYHPAETRYLRATELPDSWPFLFYDKMQKIQVVPTSNDDNIKKFISNSRNQLTHLIVDDNPKLPEFLQEVYYHEENYEYLNKVFDSKEEGFSHKVMLFKIDYEKFDSKD